jgi:hypothetical protein
MVDVVNTGREAERGSVGGPALEKLKKIRYFFSLQQHIVAFLFYASRWYPWN